MKIRNKNGVIQISDHVIAVIAGRAATNCFGVKGMTSYNVYDSVATFFKKDRPAQGVRVTPDDGAVDIALHLILEHGINMKTIARSIMEEVRYMVERNTGIKVNRVDIFVDTIDR